MIRAILFDAGATLLHADPPVERVYCEALSRDGARTTPAELASILETTWREVRQRKLPDRYGGVIGERGFWQEYVRRVRHHIDGGTVSDRCFQELGAHFLQAQSWAVYPDVFPTLEALRSAGFALAVVSNWDSTLGELLEAHDLASRFRAVLISAVEKAAKPHAEIFHRACGRLGVAPGEALHVGDSREEDYDAARSAGLSALLLDRDRRHPDVEERIASLAELPGRIDTKSDFG